MKTWIPPCALMLIGLLAGCGTFERPTELQSADIARIASVNVERSVRVRQALHPVTAREERDLLDAGIGQDLYYMESTEKGLQSDQTYLRQRSRSISLVKKEWLRSPPFALEKQTKEYIEKVCAETKGCPPGVLRATR